MSNDDQGGYNMTIDNLVANPLKDFIQVIVDINMKQNNHILINAKY